MAESCSRCGAGRVVGASACPYCGQAYPGARQVDELPPELKALSDRIQAGIGTPAVLVAKLEQGVNRVLPGCARAKRPLFGGGRVSELRVELGTVIYLLVPTNNTLTARREARAAGLNVGVPEVLPSSVWPRSLVRDLAAHGDRSGIPRRTLGEILS